MSSLGISDFDEYFRAANEGSEPFDWQIRLAAQAHERHRWPDRFDLPTGAGKTSIIDVAVFLLALDAEVVPPERWTPRRIAMIVDRRVVVDQASRHALALQALIRNAGDGILAVVAEQLRSLVSYPAEGAEVIDVGELRGGIARDETWCRTPDRPVILASTVDQVGSRLLFQGYGVSRSMRPIHAGLLANDSLILLDEVHLSAPFAETLHAVKSRYRSWADSPPTSPWFVSELSATPLNNAGENAWTFSLADDGQPTGSTASRILQRRISASKPARLVEVKTPARDTEKAREATAKAASSEAVKLLAEHHVRQIAVVVNRVDTARQIASMLDGSAEDDTDVILLTGRMRSFERDPLVTRIGERLQTRETLDDRATRNLVVVATQCIEAGADFDFDGLVTECASLDALRQRFGRVDRGGALAAAGTPAGAVVLGPSQLVGERADPDPVYADAAKATWQWLVDNSVERVIDLGITSLPPRTDEAALVPPRRVAPLLLPGHLDAWASTPMGDDDIVPDVARWLHGDVDAPADVHVVWRADISEALLEAARIASSDEERTLGDILSFCPPTAGETVAVPISAMRSWLQGEVAQPVADVEVQEPIDVDRPWLRPAPRVFATWDGDVARASTAPGRLRPGATLIVPSTYGGLATRTFEGLSAGSWDPNASAPVDDLGDADTPRVHRRCQVLRLLPPGTPGAPDRGPVPSPTDRAEDATAAEHVQPWLDTWRRTRGEEALPHRLVREFAVGGSEQAQGWYAVELATNAKAATADTDPATSAFTGVEARLDEHLVGVGERAAAFGEGCGAGRELVEDLTLSGQLHDLGKVDPRFQAWLRNGQRPTETEAELAKSTTGGFDRVAVRAARVRAGYPGGLRHEMLSLALIEGTVILRRSHDWDLVRHVVASHHGWCRPFAPLATDSEPLTATAVHDGLPLSAATDHGLERADRGVSDRYWSLVRRYGWFQLAWIDSLLRLADHRRSQFEQERTAS